MGVIAGSGSPDIGHHFYLVALDAVSVDLAVPVLLARVPEIATAVTRNRPPPSSDRRLSSTFVEEVGPHVDRLARQDVRG